MSIQREELEVGDGPAEKKASRSFFNKASRERLARYLLAAKAEQADEHSKPWWMVLCLTGVDYFSTLAYQPGIAALAAGALSPFATLVLVAFTIFGALPMYKRVAENSPYGEGSIAMLAKLMRDGWTRLMIIMIIIGVVMMAFVITKTLSASDAAQHFVENPFIEHFREAHKGGIIHLLTSKIIVAEFLLAALGTVFMFGFSEAIGLAVVIVVPFLALNAWVIGKALLVLIQSPEKIQFYSGYLSGSGTNVFMIIALTIIVFPRLALGMSGFETGVVVMPLVRGSKGEKKGEVKGRIRNTKLLLATAAIMMGIYLITSSVVTSTLIPPEAFFPKVEELSEQQRQELAALPAKIGRPVDMSLLGAANGKALSYLAHTYLGEFWGGVYDANTIIILWFAGASAMAGLLSIIPRYLPGLGMAPEWARATRPLVLILTAIDMFTLWYFDANVDKQAGAYSTGVLVFMGSGAVAVAIAVGLLYRAGEATKRVFYWYIAVAFIFGYATVVNIWERPDGLWIAIIFILGIFLTGLASRHWRRFEFRCDGFDVTPEACTMLAEAIKGHNDLKMILIKKANPSVADLEKKMLGTKKTQWLGTNGRIPIFLHGSVGNAANFTGIVKVVAHTLVDDTTGKVYRIMNLENCSSVPNNIGAFMDYLNEQYILVHGSDIPMYVVKAQTAELQAEQGVTAETEHNADDHLQVNLNAHWENSRESWISEKLRHHFRGHGNIPQRVVRTLQHNDESWEKMKNWKLVVHVA